ncbi:MAG: Panacea domain-containing protein [Ignavibacteriae bacterium]|nr:Panacea domain-containing protein [Ignavibacteriota bacterium]
MYKDILNDKIGNILYFLSYKINNLTLTKALKLLYIIDETAVNEVGAPITWLDYKVWKYGPVSETIYNEINSFKKEDCSCSSLADFVNVNVVDNPHDRTQKSLIICPKNGKSFNELIFSKYEMDLLNRISEKFLNTSASELVEILHKEDTLWHKIVTSKEIVFSLELNDNRSNFSIDFTQLLKDDAIKQDIYKSANHSLNFENFLMGV